MHKKIVDYLNENVAGCEATLIERDAGDTPIKVKPEKIYDVCKALKDPHQYDFNVLQVVSGVDYIEENPRIELNYMLASFTQNTDIIIKVELPRGDHKNLPEIDSVCDLWSAADWQERETYDLIGIKFKNHPDFRRILCPEDWQGHPLRKDYVVQEEFHGMKVNPPEKINTDDHLYGARLKKQMDDPKKISISWKVKDID